MVTGKVDGRQMTADLLARLKRHYIKPGEALPGGMFIPEVAHGGAGGRRIDALYAGFFQSRGHHLIGHELKISRADWQHELAQPEKAEVWAPECHAWYVVAPSTTIVKPEELPHGWGLMIPGRSKTRMEVVVAAKIYEDREPSWLATHSILKRVDTLRAEAVGSARRLAEQANADELHELRRRVLDLAGQDTDALRNRAENAEHLLGEVASLLGIEAVTTTRSLWGRGTSLDEIRDTFGAYLRARRDVRRAAQSDLNALAGVERDAREIIARVEATRSVYKQIGQTGR